MYTILVGPAGIGKSLPLSLSEALWRELNEHHVAPTSLTKASLIDAIHDASRRIIQPGLDIMEFNCLLANISEFGVFLPAYENDFMNVLTAMWDGVTYAERRRTGDKKLIIQSPLLNVLAGSTPSYMNALMPEGAWDQGFLSRTMVIYSGDIQRVDPFAFKEDDKKLWVDLNHDLKLIGARTGKIPFSPEAGAAISSWYLNANDGPDHPKLVGYVARRLVHLLKLCTVYSVSRSTGPIAITLDDFTTALDTLIEAETHMPDIFHAMKSGGDGQAQDDLWHFVYTIYAKEKKPVQEHRLVAFLRERVPSHNVLKIIEIAVRSQMLQEKMDVATGLKLYTPAPRTAF